MTVHEAISFGPFTLIVSERRLEKSGDLVNVGGRALDLLILLIERAGEVVTKKEIFDRVWPNVTVDEVSLRVHISAIRKALSDNQAGQRYVATVAGRGYCFVAPLTRSTNVNRAKADSFVSNESQTLPAALSRMVGRAEVVKIIGDRLLADRFITIVGPGGIGKTTVAVSVARSVIGKFDGTVHFFDLGTLSDSHLVASAIASSLGLVVTAQDPTSALINFLRDRRMLLVLDSCEHLIATVAQLAERIFVEANRIYILATSREILRVEGERAYQLPPLECPPDEGITAAQVMAFAAPQLFVDRVSASGKTLEIGDHEAALIGEICRQLDGIALAIELAAGCVDAFGLAQTAALLERRFDILGQGKRTALPRHQTLRATLDWSHSLLTEFEQLVLRRLSVFVGIFTLEAARSVASDDRVPTEQVVSILAGLVAKSLVAADTTKFPSRYRLLDTTRAYTLQKLEESGEGGPSTRRHAVYFQRFLSSRRPADELWESKTEELRREYLGNVRAALEWAFSSSHDRPIAVSLAAVAARFFIGLSLLTECAKWSAMAIAAFSEDELNSAEELELQSALGLSLMFSRGNSPEAGVALGRALAIAEQLGDFPNQLQLLGRLHIFHERIGEYYAALRFAQRGVAVAAELGDPIGIAEAHSAIGISRHLEGDQVRALAHLEAALVNAPATENIDTFHFGFDFRNRAKIARARVQWLLGYPDQAVKTAIETVNEASTTEHPITHCIALIWAVDVFAWCGNLVDAEEYIDRFIDEANRHSLMPYQAVGRGVKAELAIKSGNAARGVEALQLALEAIHLNRYELMTSEFSVSLAEGLLATGRAPEALSTIQIALQAIDKNGDLFMKPEILRVQGNILAAGSDASPIEIEEVYTKATRMAEAQGALALALRGATSLAIFLSAQGRLDEAQEALIPIYMRFNEGFDTSDLKAARRVLDQLVEL